MVVDNNTVRAMHVGGPGHNSMLLHQGDLIRSLGESADHVNLVGKAIPGSLLQLSVQTAGQVRAKFLAVSLFVLGRPSDGLKNRKTGLSQRGLRRAAQGEESNEQPVGSQCSVSRMWAACVEQEE